MEHRTKVHGVSDRLVDLGPNNQNLVAFAEDVAIERGTVVSEIFFHGAAIRSLNERRGHDLVSCVKAHVQDMSATHGQQAAHLLPGQILVAGRPIWDLARPTSESSSPELSSEAFHLALQTRQCFAKTNVLPALFNRADSQAEAGVPESRVAGLKELFGATVQNLWSGAKVDGGRPLTIDRSAVIGSLDKWFRQVNVAYETASARKRLAAAGEKWGSDARAARSDEAEVLSAYARSFKVANAARFVEAHLPQIAHRYRNL